MQNGSSTLLADTVVPSGSGITIPLQDTLDNYKFYFIYASERSNSIATQCFNATKVLGLFQSSTENIIPANRVYMYGRNDKTAIYFYSLHGYNTTGELVNIHVRVYGIK